MAAAVASPLPPDTRVMASHELSRCLRRSFSARRLTSSALWLAGGAPNQRETSSASTNVVQMRQRRARIDHTSRACALLSALRPAHDAEVERQRAWQRPRVAPPVSARCVAASDLTIRIATSFPFIYTHQLNVQMRREHKDTTTHTTHARPEDAIGSFHRLLKIILIYHRPHRAAHTITNLPAVYLPHHHQSRFAGMSSSLHTSLPASPALPDPSGDADMYFTHIPSLQSRCCVYEGGYYEGMPLMVR